MSSSRITNIILSLWLVQSVFTSAASANDDEYVQKSIFRTLKEKNGQFASEMQITKHKYGRRCSSIETKDHEEKFNFKTNTGEYKVYRFDSYSPEHILYVNGKEVYYHDQSNYCYSGVLDKYEIWDNLRHWSPKNVFHETEENKKHNFQLLGPNSLLEVFHMKYDEDKDKIKCEDSQEDGAQNPKKCSIMFGNSVRLDYSFVDKAEHTMVPTKIERSANKTGEWRLTNEIKYLNFTPIFSGEPIVTSDLPIQKGCNRIDNESYPKIQTDYGKRFELELEVLFKYSESNWNPMNEGKLNYTVRSYSVKLHVDKTNSINVAETIDEMTNASIRTYYDEKSHLLHSVTVEDEKCRTYNLTSNSSLNMFYIQELFVRRPKLFNANANFSYLREFSLDDVPTQVFEKSIVYDSFYYGGKTTTRKRNNSVSTSGRLLTTQYYPKDANYWPDNPNGLSIPKRIEISAHVFKTYAINPLKIDIKSFKSSPEKKEKYDTSKCENMDK